MRLSQAESTVVAVSWSVPLGRRQTNCSVSSTPQPESYRTHASTIVGRVSSSQASYIGWFILCVTRGVQVSAQYGTCRHCVNPSPVFLALSWSRPPGLSPYQTVHIRGTRIRLRWPNHLELTSYQSHRLLSHWGSLQNSRYYCYQLFLLDRVALVRGVAAYSHQTFPWTICWSVDASVCLVYCGKRLEGSRDEARSAVWGSVHGKGYFDGYPLLLAGCFENFRVLSSALGN